MAVPSADNSPILLPLVTPPANRAFSTNTDAKLVNAYAEKFQDGWRVCKRPGFSSAVAPVASGSGPGRGVFRLSVHFYELRDRLYVDGFDEGAYNNGPSAFYWFNNTLSTPEYIYFSNGTTGYTYSGSGTLAQITDPDYPATTVRGSAYLDGTLYVMDTAARIFGSAINNPTSWSALNMIRAQVTPDNGIAIAKTLIYVAALKEYSVEFFYDAGNPTGSPLLPLQNAKLAYGCFQGTTVQEIDDMIFYVATTREGGILVGKIAGLKFERISTPAIERLLEFSAVPQISHSFAFRNGGHTFYAVAVPSSQQTLVYDVYEDQWAIWEGLGQIRAASGYSVKALTSNAFQLVDGTLVATDEGQFLSEDFLSGATSPIQVDVITPNFDGGTRLKKFLQKLRIRADQRSGGTLLVRWSDDDYKTWSQWTTVNLQQEDPVIYRLGTFRKRAFQFRSNSSTPFRLEPCELELMLGSL